MENFEKPPQLNSGTPPLNDARLPQPAPEQKGGSLTSKIKESFEVAKEKGLSLAEYRGLKIKEYLGRLNEEEFNKLLDLDFQNQLRDNPSIDKVFSPEAELARIRSLPKEGRREALDKFKENLATQREALANCRVFIERCIEFNHDVPKKKLVGLIGKFSTQYGFTEKQKQITEQLIDGYYTNRQRALEIRERFPNDTALVKELSDIEFDNTAKFDISTGPMSIDITTNGFNAGRIFQNSKNIVIKLQFGGFAAKSQHKQPVPYIVINKSNFWQGRLRHRDALIHEYEHQKNRLFREIFEKQADPSEEILIFSQYESEQDPELKKGLLEAYFRLRRRGALQHAKDEIIAMKKDGGSYSYDFFFMKDKSPYDYLTYVRDWEAKKNDSLWQETAERILVDGYRKVLESAVSAFDRLKKEGGYTRDEIIAMLVDRPLPEWPKTAKRLLEQKVKKLKSKTTR